MLLQEFSISFWSDLPVHQHVGIGRTAMIIREKHLVDVIQMHY